jgi:hypothetical protein
VTNDRLPPLWIGITVAFFQSPGSVPLFIVMSSSRARYGIIASPPNLRISPEIRSGPTHLFFPIVWILLLIVLISVVNGSSVFFTLYVRNIALAAEYCRIIRVKRIGLFYRVCNEPSVTVLNGGNIFLISFTPFYIFVEISPAFTLFA